MAHVVTTPTPAFRSASGALEVHQVLSLSDNLIWMAICTETGEAAVIDGPDIVSWKIQGPSSNSTHSAGTSMMRVPVMSSTVIKPE